MTVMDFEKITRISLFKWSLHAITNGGCLNFTEYGRFESDAAYFAF